MEQGQIGTAADQLHISTKESTIEKWLKFYRYSAAVMAQDIRTQSP